VLTDNYYKITNYLTDTFGANFILYSILITAAVSIGYLIGISYIITHMDKRYFVRNQISDDAITLPLLTFIGRSGMYLVKIAKIILGLCLLVCGVVMLVLPGQGLITMLIGLSLIPFPGKHKIELNLLSRNSVRSTLNWIRIKANKEPFIFD
jgi:hypothetical protein